MKNRIFSGVFWRRFLPLVLCWVSALPLYSLPLDTGGSGTDSGSVLSRLMAISNELAFLNERLRNELGDSMRNSKELRDMLEASKRELAGMRTELEDLRSGSIVLLNTAEKSGTELSGLRQALSQAESSLVSLEQSFAAYRVAAEMRIQSLEKSRDIWRIAFFAACAVGAGAVGAVLISGK